MGVREAVFEHPASVARVAVSHDGALVVTAGADGVLRLWDVARGELRGARTITDAPGRTTLQSAPWRPDPKALAEAEGWLGFSLRGHPLTARRRAGLAEIVDGERVCARVVTHDELTAAPNGARWASRTDHVSIEDER